MRMGKVLRGIGMHAAALMITGLIALAGTTASAADKATIKTPARDWSKAPAVVQADTTHDLYALGDIHGDYKRLVTLLAAAKVIGEDPKTPADVEWKAGKAVLVCTGDLIDKDHHALPVIALLQALQAAAAKAGGQVIVTMGNHEAEFLANPDCDKKDKDFVKELDGVKRTKITPDEVAAGTDSLGIGKFFLGLPVAARVNDWFFCHAGNTGNLSISALSSAIQSGVDADGYGAAILSADDSLVEARMHPHPWWEVKGKTPAQDQAALAATVGALGGINHLVFGHQPGDVTFADGTTREHGTLIQKFDGLVFLIDVGMSKGIGDKKPTDGYSKGFLLRVHTGNTEATLIDHTGKETTIWKAPKKS